MIDLLAMGGNIRQVKWLNLQIVDMRFGIVCARQRGFSLAKYKVSVEKNLWKTVSQLVDPLRLV